MDYDWSRTRAQGAPVAVSAKARETREVRPKLVQQGFLQFPVCASAAVGALAAAAKDDPTEDDPLGAAFAEVRTRLDSAKSSFDAISTEEFEPLMRELDLYHDLKAVARTQYSMQVASNASLKMYEILTRAPQLLDAAGPIRVFCNAELPGAFVATINHFVRTRRAGADFDWVASSFMPSRGRRELLGDTYGLLAGNRERWLMDESLNGDLTDAAAVEALAARARARLGGGATLYTSDAGVDASADFNRQEEMTARLNFGQVLCGVLALAPGGSLVTKQYTFFTPFSRSLIALLTALFDSVAVTKPLASRPVNSEVYIVARGFRGVAPELARALLARLADTAAAPPLLGAAARAEVDLVLLRIARQLYGRQQVSFLEEAAEAYARRAQHAPAHPGLRPARAAAQQAWMLENPLRACPESAWLASAK